MNWLQRFFNKADGDINKRITLKELSARTGIKYITLYRAIQEGRLEAVQSGSIWLCSIAAVRKAQDDEKMK